MALPEQLLLSDLLRLRVRCDQGLDHGAGVQGWMHPPVHRLLGWATRPSAFGPRREVWRLNQLRGLGESEALVKGEPAETDPGTLERLPTLLEAALLGRDGQILGTVADAAVELASGRILHYLVSRSDPRLPGSSRWRLVPERIVDQQPGQVVTALAGLDDLPLARASVRQELLRRSRHWREQFQQVGDRVEERLEGWLEEPGWDESERPQPRSWRESDEEFGGVSAPPPSPADSRQEWDPLEDWEEEEPPATGDRGRSRRDEDPWI